jgi:hypothetical protein
MTLIELLTFWLGLIPVILLALKCRGCVHGALLTGVYWIVVIVVGSLLGFAFVFGLARIRKTAKPTDINLNKGP